MKDLKSKLYFPYLVMLAMFAIFIVAALFHDSPADIFDGLIRISLSRSVLITDYMAVGGEGATLVNAAIVGGVGILMLMMAGVKPNGSIIMALWLSVGFAMFGKNVTNMLPLSFGVWLYARYKKEPFINFSLVALLSATLSPVVSGIAFHPDIPRHISIPLGMLTGVLAGFVFPSVSSFCMRVHGGNNLYNLGFAGGVISTFVVAMLQSFDIKMERELVWSQGNNISLALLLYVISAVLMVIGLFPEGEFKLPPYKKMCRSAGRLVTDFYIMYGNAVYFNMGLLCALATTLMLVLGASLNGPTLAGIFTIVGFAAFGKHLRNVFPVITGAVVCTYVNVWDPGNPTNILAILFSTGLAPIAGQYGPVWGFVAGFLHVNLIMHIGFLNNGLNLYNNGYAAGFVALLLIPVINALRREGEGEK